MRKRWTLAGCLVLAASLACAEEGKWTPEQVLRLDPAWLKSMGLELPPNRLWDPQRGTGLLAAAVNIGGCSAGFVSRTGLILTNHHCLFSLIQEHSRPDLDLITNGFLARTREEELPGKTIRVTVPRKFTDVTKDVASAIPAGADDLARLKSIERKGKALVAACENTPGTRCNVAAFDGGLQYVLVESLELTDVRLVYAPPRAIGEFGGEPDNFRWPRHTGDFSMARAYKDGKPYEPEFYFPIARTGVKAGDFVMVLGYPGRTMRSLTAAEMGNEQNRFTMRNEVYGEWIRLLEETTRADAAGSIAVAATLKGLNNSHTNAQGQLAGLARGHILERQSKHDDAVMTWAKEQGGFERALSAKQELDQLAREQQATAGRDFLFQAITAGPMALRHATTLVRLAAERVKSDSERDPEYMERQLAPLRARLERDQKSFYRRSDEAVFASWLERASRLPAAQSIAAVRNVAGVKQLYDTTKVTDVTERLRMFDETTAQLHARNDPLLEFAFALEPELRAWQKSTQTREGAVARLRPEWRRAVIAHAAKPVAPDANGTLRVSFAHLEGYVPRDGVLYTPQSTLAGMLEKHTGEEPFAVPPFIREAANRVDPARIPLDFLSNADTTGGNSGSPVVNGRGELVGLNFDRVWENVANDFGYNPAIARNISVDVRFLVWLLRDVQRAGELMKELGMDGADGSR